MAKQPGRLSELVNELAGSHAYLFPKAPIRDSFLSLPFVLSILIIVGGWAWGLGILVLDPPVVGQVSVELVEVASAIGVFRTSPWPM